MITWVESSAAFIASHGNRYPKGVWSVRSMVKEAPSDVGSDVSIPYDAAARLAYEEWRAQFNKGAFDKKRYEIFKMNYETITVANVSAKKLAREQGSKSLTLMSLNEFGDLTEEEYNQAIKSGSKKMSTGDVLSKAVENAELQSEASSALGEAADALAEEEKKLAEKLGLKSVEELEVALDSLDGIAPDGGELDSENLAREARIRDAYLKWCKEYGKIPDESRYPTFSNNFLLMEQYAKETNKEMNLNQYADCTKEEYEAMQSAAGKPTIEEQLEKAAKAALEAKEKFDAEMEIRRKELEEEMKIAAEVRARRVEMQAERAKLEAEKRVQIEKERAERLKQQEAMKAKKQAEIEATLIATAKAEEARQARLSAERARIEAKAAEQARKQAKEWDDKQKRMAEISAAGGMAPKKVEKKPSIFAAFFAAPSGATLPPAPKKSSMVAKVAPKPAETPNLSFMSFLSPEPKDESKPAPKPLFFSPTQKETPAPSSSLFSFLAPPAPAPQPKVASKPAPAPAAPTPAFSFFSAPAPSPAAPSPAAPSPAFSFFSPPAPAPKVAAPYPVKKEKESPFSFLSMPVPTQKVATVSKSVSIKVSSSATKPKASVQIPNRAGTISIGQKPKEKASTGTMFSFFGSGSQASSPSVQIPKVTAKVAISKSVSVFNTPKAAPKVVPSRSLSVFGKPTPEPKVVASKSFSVFAKPTGAPAKPVVQKAPPKNVPVLSKWKQNSDGSITGNVSNSPNFKPGTKVTTSPVPKGAKAGTVVKTISGSQYYLD